MNNLELELYTYFYANTGHKFKFRESFDFFWLENTSTIEYKLSNTEDYADKVFRDFCIEDDNLDSDYCDIPIFLLSLLHELGHYYTNKKITKEEMEKSEKERERLSELEEFGEYDYYDYFNLPDEYMATQWAINFINKNYASLMNLWENTLKHFFD